MSSRQPVHCILLPLHGQGLQHWNCPKLFYWILLSSLHTSRPATLERCLHGQGLQLWAPKLLPAVKSSKTYQQAAHCIHCRCIVKACNTAAPGSCCQVCQNIPAGSLSIVSRCRCMVKACNTEAAPKLFYWILLSSLSKHTSRQPVHCILLPLHSQGLQHWNCSKTFLLDPAVKSSKMYQQAACPLFPAAVA